MKHKVFFKRQKKILSWVYQVCPIQLPLTILEECIKQGRPFLTMYLGACIIDEIMAKNSEKYVIGLALTLVLSNMALALIQWAIDKILIIRRRETGDKTDAAMTVKSLTLDYQVMERAETQDMLTRISEGISYSGGVSSYCHNLAYLVGAVISVIYAVVLIIPLFLRTESAQGGIAGFVNSGWSILLFAVLLFSTVLFQYRMNQKTNQHNNDLFEFAVRTNRRIGHFNGYIENYPIGKSIRVFGMLDLLSQKMEKEKRRVTAHWLKVNSETTKYLSGANLANAIFLLCSYIYVGIKTISGTVSLGDLTFYVGILTTLVQNLSTIMNIYGFINMTSQYLVCYVDFLELTNEKYDGTIPVEKRLDNEYVLEFRNVSFHYPNNEELVLDHVNAKIRVGGKMAIVGPNGSGKSTFIKLLCRLYDPTEGEILLNGIDIRKYDYDEYRNLFGVVFQDFQLFSFSIAQNVAAGVDYDEARVWECLEQAGLKSRVESYEHGIEEIIYKQGDDDGVEISGGEAQKLAIARALYKNAPVVIMDGPTAALDPISELEIYERFDGMVQEKTAIYISHRMSSCRFCENIVVFDAGKIVQMGSHESLLKEKEGLYSKLWNVQAQYYAG